MVLLAQDSTYDDNTRRLCLNSACLHKLHAYLAEQLDALHVVCEGLPGVTLKHLQAPAV